jgi:hypothetical protein
MDRILALQKLDESSLSYEAAARSSQSNNCSSASENGCSSQSNSCNGDQLPEW